MGKTKDLVQRAFGLLILKTIALEPNHGWAIAKRRQQVSRDVLQVQQKAGRRAKWAETETVRPAKFNSLTAAAPVQVRNEAANWGHRRLS